jgi:hypothetical protein
MADWMFQPFLHQLPWTWRLLNIGRLLEAELYR